MQSQLQTEVGVEVRAELGNETYPGGWTKTKLMQSHLQTEVGVEVEAELGNDDKIWNRIIVRKNKNKI